jgi:hypothetical protein
VANAANTVLQATASDADGDSLGYAWTSSAGTIASPKAASTPATFPLGTSTVQVAVTDGFSTTNASTTITVRDTKGPVVTPPPDITITGCNAPNVGTATAFDACTQTSATVTSNKPSRFPLGTTVVTYTAVDRLGNVGTATQRVTANLGGSNLPVGSYKSFRLVIDADKSSITMNDNSKPDIKWPSAGKNGIKIILDKPFDVTTGTTNLLIDFDVGRSFVVRGNSISQNGLLFKPVIHATTQQSTGAISGTVRGDNATGPVIAGATVEVLKAGTTLGDTNPNNIVRTAVTDANGNFTLAFVPPGTYVVRATPTVASGYKPALLPGTATVTAGSTLGSQVIIVTK